MYPFRTSGRDKKSATWEAVTREEKAEMSLAANLAMHYAVPTLANEDSIVAQGIHYPQRYALGTFLVGLFTAG